MLKPSMPDSPEGVELAPVRQSVETEYGQFGRKAVEPVRRSDEEFGKTPASNVDRQIQRKVDEDARRRQARVEGASHSDMNMDYDDKPSYVKLMAHIGAAHPRKEQNDKGGRKFGICDELGYYPVCCCKQRPVSQMAKEIGLGPTMFLISAKSLAWFFVVLTILNVPTYMFFYASN